MVRMCIDSKVIQLSQQVQFRKLDVKSHEGKYDAGFSSSKLCSSCLPFVVKQTTLPVFS
jgi:hypothetical protein